MLIQTLFYQRRYEAMVALSKYKIYHKLIFFRSHQRCSVKEGAFRLATLLKEKLWQRCFPVNFAKFLRTPFSQSTYRRLLLIFYHSSNFYEKPSFFQYPRHAAIDFVYIAYVMCFLISRSNFRSSYNFRIPLV